MTDAFEVVRMFEKAVCEYTGAPYCVAVNSCTNAIGLCLENYQIYNGLVAVSLPKRTYVGVAQQAKLLGYHITFLNYDWQHNGRYRIGCTNIYDSARLFTSGMYCEGADIEDAIICTSHHWSKHLSTEQGGCILHNSPFLDQWLRKMRFDGRTEGVAVKDDKIDVLGRHCYMSPSSAALGLTNLHFLPKHNKPLPEANYPDLSTFEIFK